MQVYGKVSSNKTLEESLKAARPVLECNTKL